MPAITIPSPPKEESTFSPPAPASVDCPPSDYFDHKPSRSRSSSPERPPVSPITPVTSHAELAPLGENCVPPTVPTIPPTEFIAAPKPEPIKEWNENEDVLALRSAISLLQMQREKAKKDLRALEHVKQTAIADPEAYLQDLKARRQAPPKPTKTLADILGPADAEALAPTLSDGDEDDAEDDGNGDSGTPDGEASANTSKQPKFPVAPQPQNIVRCPPINWTKYHVVGDTLDKMHAEQVARPNSDGSHAASKLPPHHVMAPYNPFTDKLARPGDQPSAQTKKGSKKPNT